MSRILILVILLSSTISAQPIPELVLDREVEANHTLTHFPGWSRAISQDRVIFLGDANGSGSKIFVSENNGSAALPIFDPDTHGGLVQSYSDDSGFRVAATQDFVFFISKPAGGLPSLWRTDGTLSGTQKIYTSLYPELGHFFVFGSKLLLIEFDDDRNAKLLSSDGFSVSTLLEFDLFSIYNRGMGFFAELGGTVFFGGIDPLSNKAALFKTNGDTASIYYLLTTPTLNRDPTFLSVIGSKLYMGCNLSAGSNTRQPCWSDGIEPANLSVIKKIGDYPDPEVFKFGGVEFGTNIFFSAYNRLWKSDGTAGGTEQISSLVIGQNSYHPMAFGKANGRLILSASSTSNFNGLNEIFTSTDGLVFNKIPNLLLKNRFLAASNSYAIGIDAQDNLIATNGTSFWPLTGLRSSGKDSHYFNNVVNGKLLATETGTSSRFVLVDLNTLQITPLGYQLVIGTGDGDIAPKGVAGADRCLLERETPIGERRFFEWWNAGGDLVSPNMFESQLEPRFEYFNKPIILGLSRGMIVAKRRIFRGRDHMVLSRTDGGTTSTREYIAIPGLYSTEHGPQFSPFMQTKDVAFLPVESKDRQGITIRKIFRTDGTQDGTYEERYALGNSDNGFAIQDIVPYNEKIYQSVSIFGKPFNYDNGSYIALFKNGIFNKWINAHVEKLNVTEWGVVSPIKRQSVFQPLKIVFWNENQSPIFHTISPTNGIISFLGAIGDKAVVIDQVTNSTDFASTVKLVGSNGTVTSLTTENGSSPISLEAKFLAHDQFALLWINNKLFSLSKSGQFQLLRNSVSAFLPDYRKSYLPLTGALFFTMATNTEGKNGELYMYDGSTVTQIQSLNALESTFPNLGAILTQCGGSLMYTGNSMLHGLEIWKIDVADYCPSDPHKLSPGACGCGIPDVDSDGNGNVDCFNIESFSHSKFYPRSSLKFKISIARVKKDVVLTMPKTEGANYVYKYSVSPKPGIKRKMKTKQSKNPKIKLKKIKPGSEIVAQGAYIENGVRTKFSKKVKFILK